MNDTNLQIAAPVAAFTRSAAPSGFISLNGSGQVAILLAVIAEVYSDAPQAMLATAASHFANYIGVPLADLKTSTVESTMDGFGLYLGKLRKKNGEKLGRNSVRSYKNYAQMLLRPAKELGWSRSPSKVEIEWNTLFSGVELKYGLKGILRFAVDAEVPVNKFSDEHLKAFEKLKIGRGRHRKYARGLTSRFRLVITKAGLRKQFPLISHPLDDYYFRDRPWTTCLNRYGHSCAKSSITGCKREAAVCRRAPNATAGSAPIRTRSRFVHARPRMSKRRLRSSWGLRSGGPNLVLI